MIRKASLIAFLLFLAFNDSSKAQEPSVANNEELTIDTSTMAKAVLYYVNQHRQGVGLPPLQLNTTLCDIARGHSINMAHGAVPFSHDGFEERVSEAWKLIPPQSPAAENIAEGVKSAKAVVNLWLRSPGHRRNIEGNYTIMGLGIATNEKGVVYFTQMFLDHPQKG
ncbi:MAG: CAP domain-containing protein [Flavipsychrobacter sp.]